MRKYMHFYGTVQGVGFRWMLRRFAQENHVTGWVRNDADGTVTAELQGTRQNIDRVVHELEGFHNIQITKISAREIPEVRGETEMEVRYYW